MLLREYYRKDTPDKIKGLIKEIVAEKGKSIPSIPELEKRIGKFEKQFDKLTKQSRTLWENMIETEKKFDRISKTPGVTPEEIATSRIEMDRVVKLWRAGKSKVDSSQSKLEVQERENLKDLW